MSSQTSNAGDKWQELGTLASYSQDEETVMVGIILPVTTQDEQEGGPTTKGYFSLSMSSKAGKSTRLILIDVEKSIPGDRYRVPKYSLIQC